MSTPQPETVESSRPPRRRNVGRWLLLVGLLLVVLAVVMAWQALTAYRHLDRAQGLLPSLSTSTLRGDTADGKRQLDTLQDEAGAAKGALDGPQWAVAAHLPFVGNDIHAARTVTQGIDDLARGALPQLLDGAEAAYPRSGSLRGGRVDLARVAKAKPPLTEALATLETVDQRNDGIEESELNGRLRRPVERFVDTVARARRGTSAAVTAVRLMPSMLGGDRPRTYLVMNQNTAEQRILGGIPGSILVVRAVRGKVSLVDTLTASGVGRFDRPVVPLTQAEKTLHGETLSQYIANVTDVPDFRRSATFVRAMWEERYGMKVDGVLATDPYALQLILRAVGPVKVKGSQTLTGANAAQVLLNQTYFDYPVSADQDAFFADSAEAVFDKLTSGVSNPRGLVQALAEAVDGGRMLVWSGHRDEQARLADSRIAGQWPPTPASPPQLGVFFHDRTQSKIDWYQRVGVTATCARGGARTVRARVTVRSTVPRDVRSLPGSITGDGSQIRRGDTFTQVLAYAPPGWTFTRWKADDGDNQVTMMKSGPSWAATRNIKLTPGASRSLEFELRATTDVTGLKVRTTPGVTPDNVHVSVRDCGN